MDRRVALMPRLMSVSHTVKAVVERRVEGNP